MEIKNLVSPSRSRQARGQFSRKHVFQFLSEIISEDLPEVSCEALYEAFIAREKLGSTTLGHGVAIPHIRAETIKEPVGAMLHFPDGVILENESEQRKVDLVFALAVPQEAQQTHLEILAEIAKKFSQPAFRQRVRECSTDTDLYKAITTYD